MPSKWPHLTEQQKSPTLLHWCNIVGLDSVGVNLVVAHDKQQSSSSK